MPIDVDLGSDTKTRPCAAMREAMATAPVGDEQAFEDPTVNALCERVAELMGHEEALFLPSGTMANAIAYRLHCRTGEELICDATAHAIHNESGSPGLVAGAMCQAIHGERGVFTPEQVRDAIRGSYRHDPRSVLLLVENTSNGGGGTVWPLERVRAVTDVAREHGLATHMDGARLVNATAATGHSLADYARLFDTAWIDFSKGLGAPVGAALVGSRALIHEAWRIKQALGGAMRQAGVIAAAARYALDHNLDRLAEDHVRAKRLATGLHGLPGLVIEPLHVETNLVYFEIDRADMDASGFCDRLKERHGVRMGAMSKRRVRAVTHLDVDDAGIEKAIAGAAAILGA